MCCVMCGTCVHAAISFLCAARVLRSSLSPCRVRPTHYLANAFTFRHAAGRVLFQIKRQGSRLVQMPQRAHPTSHTRSRHTNPHTAQRRTSSKKPQRHPASRRHHLYIGRHQQQYLLPTTPWQVCKAGSRSTSLGPVSQSKMANNPGTTCQSCHHSIASASASALTALESAEIDGA
jgi:hypothetical protein